METTNTTGEWFDACDEYTSTPSRRSLKAFKIIHVTPTIIYVFGTTQEEWELMA